MRIKGVPRKYKSESKIILNQTLLQLCKNSKVAKMECSQRYEDLSDDVVVLDGPQTPNNSLADISTETQQGDLDFKPLHHSTPTGQRWLSQDSLNDLLRAPKKVEKSLSRRERLLKRIEEDNDFAPERSENFWDHFSVKRTGLIFVRGYYDSFRDQDMVYWMKLNFRSSESGNDYSYFKIPVSEASELVQNLNFIISEIGHAEKGEIIPLLRDSPFADSTDREDIARYWNKAHSLYLKSGKVAVRPHINFDGLYTIKLWYPKELKEHNWNGPQMTMYVGQAKSFCRYVKEIERQACVRKDFDLIE